MRTRLRVKEVAKEKGVSMTRLHTRSEVAYGTIRKIYRDPYYMGITLFTLHRLAETLGVSVRDLIETVEDDGDDRDASSGQSGDGDEER